MMGYKEFFVCDMKCREYFCPTCYDKDVKENTDKDIYFGLPLYTREEYLELVNYVNYHKTKDTYTSTL
jgi:hypothetical protein